MPVTLPSSDVLRGAQASVGSINRAVEQSRRLGAPARILVVGAVVAQAVFALLLPFKTIPPAYFAVAAIALVVGLTLLVVRRAWIRESREPFRYTFWVGAFAPLPEVPGSPTDGAERLAALSPDLTKLFSERVGRLSLLADEHVDPKRWDGGRSHIHVRGDHAIRLIGDARSEEEKERIVEVRAWVRLGIPGNPETLAPRCEFTAVGPVDAAAYEQILERVYFSVASEIYRQIRSDVEAKIRLLPRGRLRAAAYFYEAIDYSRSSTLDAYAAARDLFKRAIELYDPTEREPSQAPLRRPLSAAGRLLSMGWCAFRRRVAWLIAPRLAHPDVMAARARVGRARMLVYHQSLAGLSGQTVNAAFEARPLAARAGAGLDAIPTQAPGWHEARFNALVTEAHAWFAVSERDQAKRCLESARRLAPTLTSESSEFLFVSALVEEHRISSLQLLRASLETGPGAIGEVVQFELALRSEYLWRSRSRLEPSVGERVVEDYRALLRRNPGIVGAWGNLAYVLWLLGKPEEARRALERGRDYKSMKGETFVSELDYGLARLAAERGDIDAAYGHYIDAVSAFLRRGASGQQANYLPYYFDFIGTDILERFRRYAISVRSTVAAAEKGDNGLGVARLHQSVFAFVLNDYGQACWSYYLRTGDERAKRRAIVAFQSACSRNPDFLLPRWNLFTLHSWLGTETDGDTARDHLAYVRRLDPHWPDGVLAEAELNADRAWSAMQEARELAQRAERVRDGVGDAEDVETVYAAVGDDVALELFEGPDTFGEGTPMIAHPRHRAVASRATALVAKQKGIAGTAVADGFKLLRPLLPHAWLDELFAAADDNPQSLARATVRVTNSKRIRWETDVTILHVRSLEILAKLVFSVGTPEAVVAATALMQTLQSHYWPTKLLDWEARAEFALDDPRTPRRMRGVAKSIVRAHEQRWTAAVELEHLQAGRLASALRKAGEAQDGGDGRRLPWERTCVLLNWRAALWDYDDDWARLDWARWISYELQGLGLEREAMQVFESARSSGRESIFLTNVASDLFTLGLQSADLELECWDASADAYAEALRIEPPRARAGARIGRRLAHAITLWAVAGARERRVMSGDARDAYRSAVDALDVLAHSMPADRAWRVEVVENLRPHAVSPRAHRELRRWLLRERDRHARGTPRRADADDSLRLLISTRFTSLREHAGVSDSDQAAAMPLEISAGEALFPAGTDWWMGHPLFTDYIPDARVSIEQKFGVQLPGILVRVDGELAPGQFALSLDKVTFAKFWVPGSATEEWRFCPDAKACAHRGLGALAGPNPSGGEVGMWLRPREWSAARANDLPQWDHYRYFVESLASSIPSRLGKLVGPDDVAAMLERAGRVTPERRALVANIVGDDRRLLRLTRVARALLEEQVPLVDMSTILGEFDARRTQPVGDVVEGIRGALREAIRARVDGRSFVELRPELEAALQRWTRPGRRGAYLALPREELSAIRARLRSVLTDRDVAVLVTKPGLRPLVQRLVRLDLPDVPVIARSELRGTVPTVEASVELAEEVTAT